MAKRLMFVLAATLILGPLVAEPLLAQRGGRGGGRGRGNAEPPPPAPRDADGKILWEGQEPGQTGLWMGAFGGLGTLGSEQFPYEAVPLQPWARALYDDRQTHELEPHARCKASDVMRQFQTPYGVEFVEIEELQRIYIFDVGGPHTFRTIYMDGRGHPDDLDLRRSGYGHSIGWWEGDTLVVDTVGFDESFWLDRRGIPHTDALHTLERFTRTDFNTIEYEMTFNDPGALTAPWTGTITMRYNEGQELFEYICQQANYAHELMIGDQESVDRTATTVP